MTTKEFQEALTDLIVKAEESIAARDREGYTTCLREIKRITLAWNPGALESEPPVYTRLLTDEEMEVLKNGIVYDFGNGEEK